MERFSIKELNEECCQVRFCAEFTALEKSDDHDDNDTMWETIKENIKISAKASLGYYELKQHIPW
jgi:hypothetical protein